MKWLLSLALVGCRAQDAMSYAWDDRVVLCSDPVDDLDNPLDFGLLEARFAEVEQRGSVALIHAHHPGVTIAPATIERILAAADAHHLQYFTFDQLTPDGPGGPGVAFAFDDDFVESWLQVADTFRAHHARITFFVTRWYELSPDSLAGLATLAADGHDLEAHSHDHVNAADYVRDHSLDDYLSVQVLPSIQIMNDAGYHPTSFAFPFGVTTPAISAAVLAHIGRVRTTSGSCPN